MHRIRCPFCGVRDEAEFAYRGDATKARPDDDADEAAFFDHVYRRADPKGWHVEWWYHAQGCRRFVKVVRHTVTHQIAWTGWPTDVPEVPE
jgi:sarcosine oxidase subunit delta